MPSILPVDSPDRGLDNRATETTATASDGLRRFYVDKAMPSVGRILSLMDRNEFSPTYGCVDREYWLCRSTDFPSAIAQASGSASSLEPCDRVTVQ